MLVRETSLFITTCHSVLKEDNISTVLHGRSGFSWSCSLRTSQEVSLFSGRGKEACLWRKKWSSAMPPEVMCLKKYLWPLQQEGLRLQAGLIPWTQCSLDGKPSRTPPSAYKSGAAPSPDSLFPLSQFCLSRTRCGTRCCWRDVTTVHSPSSWVGVYLWSWNFCLIVQKSGRIVRLSHLPRRPWRAAGSYMLLGADSLG